MDDKFYIYGRSSCPFCVEACNLLKTTNMWYKFFDLETDRRFLDEAKKFYGYETVPLVLKIDSKTHTAVFVGGYDKLKESLNVR
tara:strand:- start:1308 stop:1559 length:252 start_codon:yes stop_codon:yes gene_type:complete